MKVDTIIKDLEQSLEEMSDEYKQGLKNKSESIIQSVEYRVVGQLVKEIIETDWSNKERIQNQVYLALEERLKKTIDETWERLQSGNYRSTTLEQHLETRIAQLIDRKINEALDKVSLMVIREDQA